MPKYVSIEGTWILETELLKQREVAKSIKSEQPKVEKSIKKDDTLDKEDKKTKSVKRRKKDA